MSEQVGEDLGFVHRMPDHGSERGRETGEAGTRKDLSTKRSHAGFLAQAQDDPVSSGSDYAAAADGLSAPQRRKRSPERRPFQAGHRRRLEPLRNERSVMTVKHAARAAGADRCVACALWTGESSINRPFHNLKASTRPSRAAADPIWLGATPMR